MPQPKSGTWLIDLSNVTCIDEELKFNLTMNGCVDSCGEYDGRGECMTYYTEGNVIMSTCNCKAGNYILNVMLIIIQTVVNTFTSRTRDKADRPPRTSALSPEFEFALNSLSISRICYSLTNFQRGNSMLNHLSSNNLKSLVEKTHWFKFELMFERFILLIFSIS